MCATGWKLNKKTILLIATTFIWAIKCISFLLFKLILSLSVSISLWFFAAFSSSPNVVAFWQNRKHIQSYFNTGNNGISKNCVRKRDGMRERRKKICARTVELNMRAASQFNVPTTITEKETQQFGFISIDFEFIHFSVQFYASLNILYIDAHSHNCKKRTRLTFDCINMSIPSSHYQMNECARVYRSDSRIFPKQYKIWMQ